MVHDYNKMIMIINDDNKNIQILYSVMEDWKILSLIFTHVINTCTNKYILIHT